MPHDKYNKKKQLKFYCKICGSELQGGKNGICTTPHTFRDMDSLLDHCSKRSIDYPEDHIEMVKYRDLISKWKKDGTKLIK